MPVAPRPAADHTTPAVSCAEWADAGARPEHPRDAQPPRTAGSRAPSGFLGSFARVIADVVQDRGLAPDPVWHAMGVRVGVGVGVGVSVGVGTGTGTGTGMAAAPGTGSPDAALSALRVPTAALCRGVETAIVLTGDPLLPIQAALAVRPQHLGNLGYALLSSPQGEDGLRLFERFQTLLCDEFVVRHRVSRQFIEVRHAPLFGLPMPRQAAFWWFLLGARLCFARWVSGRELVPVRLDLPCPRPLQADAFERLIGAPVRYDTPDARELMPAAWLALLNPNGDPAMHDLMAARSARQLAHRPSGDVLLAHARVLLAEMLREGQACQLDAFVDAWRARLGDRGGPHAIATPRQLRNRLAEQGLSFKDLLEEVRREEALRLLRDSTEPIAAIAQRCGYTEVSPFHRAVRRWTGLTPAQVRQQTTAE